MSGIKKRFSLFFLPLIILISLGTTVYGAEIQVPDTVRIGLYYAGTAASSFNINAEKGIQLGTIKESTYTVLYEELSGNAVTVKKDTDFHVQIGGNYKDL